MAGTLRAGRGASRSLSAKVDELYKKLGYIRDQNNGLTTQNAVLKILKCKRIECSDRQPPIGKKGECNFRINTSEQPESDSPTLDEQQTD